MALSIKSTDLDAACAAYKRATGDSPRREGIRVALHSYRQLTSDQRTLIMASIEVLQNNGLPLGASVILEALGFNEGKN
jgi:hypothetical protein